MEKKAESIHANTYAGVYLTNETNSELQFTFDKHCIKGPDDVSLQPYSSNSQTMHTNASDVKCWTSQSKGTMTCGDYSFDFELGTGAYNTEISSISNPSNFYGFLAANQYTSGNSFDFFVYSGPGILDSLINSVLNANIQALIFALTNIQLTFGSLSISLTTCSGLNSIYAAYAALAPADNGSYRITLILNSGSIDLEGQAAFGTTIPLSSASLKTTNLSVLIDGVVSFNGTMIESASVSTLKFSLDDLSISGLIFDINLILKAIMAAATSDMRVVEGILNDEFNSMIISSINTDIKNALKKNI